MVITLHYSNLLKKNCESDAACFDKALSKCSGASFTLYTQGNVYLYESFPSFGDTCKVIVTMEKAVEGTDILLRTSLEGKSMTCEFPRSKIKSEKLSEMEDFADFCSGPLKEAMYEMIVQRMYALVIANLGEISLEARKAVTGL